MRLLTLAGASLLAILPILIVLQLSKASSQSLSRYGWRFLISSSWDPVHELFGSLPLMYGTLVSSALAMVIAVPLSFGAAIWLSEAAPGRLRAPVTFLVELLAAIPSVVYGLWGIFVLAPLLRDHVEIPLSTKFPNFPLLSGQPYGVGMLAGGLILAIMVLPFITSVSQEVLRAVPNAQREAALALGATKWEAIRTAVMRYGRTGLAGAVILGLGRALGETMAITMVIGNVPAISTHLFDPGYTMASVLANEFTEASSDIYRSALIEVGLFLFLLTILVNIAARILIWRTSQGMPSNEGA